MCKRKVILVHSLGVISFHHQVDHTGGIYFEDICILYNLSLSHSILENISDRCVLVRTSLFQNISVTDIHNNDEEEMNLLCTWYQSIYSLFAEVYWYALEQICHAIVRMNSKCKHSAFVLIFSWACSLFSLCFISLTAHCGGIDWCNNLNFTARIMLNGLTHLP